jgi:hypothetical protein
MPIIPKIKEWPTRYKMPSASIMEPWEAFTGKVMKRSNVQVRLLMKAKPLEVEPKG